MAVALVSVKEPSLIGISKNEPKVVNPLFMVDVKLGLPQTNSKLRRFVKKLV